MRTAPPLAALLLALLVASCGLLTPVLADDQWGTWTPGPGAYGDLRWRSAVDLVADLPASGNVPNDVRLVVDVDTETDGEQSQLYRWSGASWEAIGSATAGTVESVDVAVPSILTSSGGPITTSGTITLGLASAPVSHVLIGPTAGFPAAPTFRALQAADVPYASHASRHSDGSDDEVAVELLATTCAIGLGIASDGAGGLDCAELGGAVSIADVTSGTTTEDYVIGAGGTLKIASTGAIDASGFDADGDGNRELYPATVGGFASICLSPADAGSCQSWFADYVGGSLYTPYVFSTGIFLGGSLAVAESQWWFRPLSGSRLLIQSNTATATLEIGNDGTRQYVDVAGVRRYGAVATAPTCSADGQSYVDTDDGSGNAADCVCLDGAWVKRAGAGSCP